VSHSPVQQVGEERSLVVHQLRLSEPIRVAVAPVGRGLADVEANGVVGSLTEGKP